MSVSGARFGRMAASYWVDADKEATAELGKAGVKTIKADPKFEADLIKVGEDLTKKWVADATERGLDGQATYDFYVSRVKALSKKTD